MITHDILQKIDNHWAVQAVGDKALRQSIFQYAKVKLIDGAIGEQLSLHLENNFSDEDALKRLAMAYEMAAIEGMKDFINHTYNDELSDQFMAGSHRAFELNRVLDTPREDDLKFIFHLLHLSSLAYCGDCWTDLRHIYDECSQDIQQVLLKEESEWDQRILLSLFVCLLACLLGGWDYSGKIHGMN